MKKEREVENGLRPFTTRLTNDQWLFLKHRSAEKRTSMQNIIRTSIKLYKKMVLKRLTEEDDTVV